MEFTFISAFLMNVPILLVSYLVNLALTGALLYRKPDLQRGSSFCDPVYFIRGYSGYMAVYTGYGRVFRGFYTGNLSGGDRVGPGNEA